MAKAGGRAESRAFAVLSVVVTAVVAWFVLQRYVGKLTVPGRSLTTEAVCPSPGGGWTLRLKWPDEVPDLDRFEVTATYGQNRVDLGNWSSPAKVKEITGLAPNTVVRIRNVTVLDNGDKSVLPTTSVAFAPSGAC